MFYVNRKNGIEVELEFEVDDDPQNFLPYTAIDVLTGRVFAKGKTIVDLKMVIAGKGYEETRIPKHVERA